MVYTVSVINNVIVLDFTEHGFLHQRHVLALKDMECPSTAAASVFAPDVIGMRRDAIRASTLRVAKMLFGAFLVYCPDLFSSTN
jgi:hypothetical protein